MLGKTKRTLAVIESSADESKRNLELSKPKYALLSALGKPTLDRSGRW